VPALVELLVMETAVDKGSFFKDPLIANLRVPRKKRIVLRHL
jgi:hypothetical protein